MTIYKHKVYNPSFDAVSSIISEVGKECAEWRFEQVVPVSPHESVAIFSRSVSDEISYTGGSDRLPNIK